MTATKESTSTTSRGGSATIQEIAIVEEVCDTYRMTQKLLVKATKENDFWKKIAGYAVYLLKTDAKADNAIIAELIGDVPSSIPDHLRYVENGIRGNDTKIISEVGRIRDRVLDRIQNMSVSEEK